MKLVAVHNVTTDAVIIDDAGDVVDAGQWAAVFNNDRVGEALSDGRLEVLSESPDDSDLEAAAAWFLAGGGS